MRMLVAGIATAVALAGCGGDGAGGEGFTSGGAEVPAVTAKGIYSGTTGDGREMVGLVLGDGTYYFLYSDVAATGIAGVVQGTGSVSGSAFTSSNARDFSIEGGVVLDATVEASFVATQSIEGSIRYASATNTFRGTYDPESERTPEIAAIAGSYGGTTAFTLGTELSSVTIGSAGALSALGESGCTASGTVRPRSDLNAYDITVTFGGSPCHFANQTFTGIAAYDADAGALIAAAPNAQRTEGFLFVGSRL